MTIVTLIAYWIFSDFCQISYQSVGQYRKAWDDFNAVVTRKPTHLAFYYVLNRYTSDFMLFHT